MPSLTGYDLEQKKIFCIEVAAVYDILKKNNLLGEYAAIGRGNIKLTKLPIIDRYAPTYFDNTEIDEIIFDLEKLSFLSPAYSRDVIDIRSKILRFRESLRLLEFKALHSPGPR